MTARRLALATIILLLVVAFFAFDLTQYLSLAYLKSQQAALEQYSRAHPLRATLVYFLVYVAVTGLSLPGALVMTLAGGALFGLLWGTVVVSFASSVGATLAFLASRTLFRDWVRARFRSTIEAIDRGVERDGAFYLFTVRLIPYFPFFAINLAFGLTPMRTATFYLVSQLGMLPATLVYVNAGSQLAQVESLGGLLTPSLIVAFLLLGLFPLIAKRFVDAVRDRRALRAHPRPRKFDRNLIVIGAGSAGLVAAYIAATVRANVSLIEKHKMGGDCLNTGCVPSKALLRSTRFIAEVQRAQELGMREASVTFDFGEIMQRVQRVIQAVAPHDSVERYTALGVECLEGEARIVSPWAVEVAGRTLTTRAIVIAAGAAPLVPPIPGLAQIPYLTSDTVWQLRERPRRLLVLGGGPVGCELAQAFARLGAQVTLVEQAERLLSREDAEYSAMVMDRFQDEDIDVRVGHTALEFRTEPDGARALVCDSAGGRRVIVFDQLLLALGRRADTAGYGLEELGIETTPAGTIEVNEYLQTRVPTIYACGDVAGPYQFTHTASHQAWYAAVNALFGTFRRFKVDYSAIPWCTFTDPEIARVGLNEQEAQHQGIPYEVTRYEIDDLDRAIADEAAYGRVKVLTVPGKDRILGVTIAGPHAGDWIIEYIAAMRHGLGLNKILRTIHIYPTFAEANKYAAGAWRRAHAPQRLLKWVERYHDWRRG